MWFLIYFFTGNYILGPLIGSSPIECLQQRLARKSGTNDFYLLKILTLDDNPKTDKEARDMMQGKVLLHSEFKLLSLCKDIEGVIRSHGLFSDFVFEEKYAAERSPMGQIYTGKVLKRIVLVLDCIYPHDFNIKSTAYIDLHHYLLRAKLPERDILGIFKKVVEIVQRLHDRNIIHSDLKLNNIVLHPVSNKVYITNFCLGRLLASENALFHDQRGSPAYIAPEILSGKPYRGKPCDMWALGVMLYTMIVGRFPFVDATPPALFKKIKHVYFTFPPDKKISIETTTLIKSLICLRPEDRYTASETLSSLDTIIQKSLKMKRPSNQIVPDIDEPIRITTRTKKGASIELSTEQFSRTLETKETRENKSVIRPNILSMQTFASSPLLSSSNAVAFGPPQNMSLAQHINNLHIYTRLDDQNSWHRLLNSVGGGDSTYVQSLYAALFGLSTRGRIPTAPNESGDFNGIVTHEISTKIANFLRQHCRSYLLVRKLFTEANVVTDRTNFLRLCRIFGVQMEAITEDTVLIKAEQTERNRIFLTILLKIAGFSNNFFVPIRN